MSEPGEQIMMNSYLAFGNREYGVGWLFVVLHGILYDMQRRVDKSSVFAINKSEYHVSHSSLYGSMYTLLDDLSLKESILVGFS